jgi:hypothetical protein
MNLHPTLVDDIKTIIARSKENAIRAIDHERTLMYWHIGKRIFEEEQAGKERADYGTYLIKYLSQKLQPEFGTGFSVRQLERYRQFFRVFPIATTLWTQLSWSQNKVLLRISKILRLLITMFNFTIQDKGNIAHTFLTHQITDFASACTFIASLPYKRNADKNELRTVFTDNGGTCSTKHAVLQKLCIEQGYQQVKLILGIFKMDAVYAPSIATVLVTYKLTYIPEAHNYLLVDGEYLDFTRSDSRYSDFKDKLLLEEVIDYTQITDYKVERHKAFLKEWIIINRVDYSLTALWEIREKCIAALQA